MLKKWKLSRCHFKVKQLVSHDYAKNNTCYWKLYKWWSYRFFWQIHQVIFISCPQTTLERVTNFSTFLFWCTVIVPFSFFQLLYDMKWYTVLQNTYQLDHRIRSIQNDQQAIRHSSVIFVAPYWQYRISCLKVQLAPLAQGADSEKWNIGLDICKKRRRMERIFEFVYTFCDV